MLQVRNSYTVSLPVYESRPYLNSKGFGNDLEAAGRQVLLLEGLQLRLLVKPAIQKVRHLSTWYCISVIQVCGTGSGPRILS